MLAVSPLSNPNNHVEKQGEVESFPMGNGDEFPDFSDGNLLDSIDFDDLFTGINDGDVLPDLKMDPELLADFSSAESEVTAAVFPSVENLSGSDSGMTSDLGSREETVRKVEEESAPTNPSPKEIDQKGRKSSSQCKNSQGKRKVKVDWTPELHRRFVQAVEQLGVDKAVPSRILELMGIDCLTRHNIASHLQKYRSHRKHLLAREAEAASWNQRRQMYGAAAVGDSKRGGVNPWVAPTIGFPPPMTAPPMHHFRPLHVWGHPHPTVDQSLMPVWPKHLTHSPPPTAVWPPAAAPPPPSHPDPNSYWHPAHHQRIASAVTPGTPCFPQPLAPTRFPTPAVAGIPPHAMYKPDAGVGVTPGQPGPRPSFDSHPSKESVDAAIGDVLTKPWLPLPLGLKPPSIDSVLGELQRQGIPKIPPGGCA